jgi:hypothetical protein
MENPPLEVSTASPLDMSTRPIRVFGGCRIGEATVVISPPPETATFTVTTCDATNGMGDA